MLFSSGNAFNGCSVDVAGLMTASSPVPSGTLVSMIVVG